MRTTRHVLISLSVALMLVTFSASMRTSVVSVKAEDSAVFDPGIDNLTPVTPTPQGAPFIWVERSDLTNYPGYKMVEGGKHNDGTMMYICRVYGTTPGKLYKYTCHYPMAGKETVVSRNYQVLMTNRSYQWLNADGLSPAKIESEAVKGGVDEGRPERPILYICRMKTLDGIHPGKYSYTNKLCYIAWGSNEAYRSNGFEILFP